MNKQESGKKEMGLEAFRDVTDERIAEYSDGSFWLNAKSLQFFKVLTDAQMPPNYSEERKAQWRNNFVATSLDVAPLVAQQVGLHEIWNHEMGKPLKPVIKQPRGMDEAEATKRVLGCIEAYLSEDGGLTKDNLALAVADIVKREVKIAQDVRTQYRADYEQEERFCRNPERLVRISHAINTCVMNRAKVITPIKEDSLSANRMMADGFMTELLFQHIAPISVWTYWTISAAINTQWGRQTFQSNYGECIQLARRLGQLAEDEVWDDHGNPVPMNGAGKTTSINESGEPGM